MRTRTFSLLVFAIIATSAAYSQYQALSNSLLDQLQGTWECPGYGKILSISNRQVREYHKTDAGCLVIPDQSQATLREQIAFVEVLSNDTFIASLTPIGNRYFWRRSSANLSQCKTRDSANALETFDFLSSYLEEHYPFFQQRNVNWELERSAARSKLRSSSSDAQLFAVIEELLEKLDDPHTSLYAILRGQIQKTSELKPRSILPILKRKNSSWNGSDHELFLNWIIQQLSGLESNFIQGQHGVIDTTPFYWRKFESVGYLHIGSMAGFKPGGNINQELQAFENALDRAFTDLAGSNSLIIDLSFNLGGYEWLSIALAQRLAREPTFVFTKTVHNDSGFQTLNYQINPSSRPRYLGPVYLLTSDITVSAGEACADAIRALPQTRHYGMRTAGAMSNVLSKPLPNGWGLTISNEIYISLDGQSYEAVGLPPEVERKLWDEQRPDQPHIERIQDFVTHIQNIEREIEISWNANDAGKSITVLKAEPGSTVEVQTSRDLKTWSTEKTFRFSIPTRVNLLETDDPSSIFCRAIYL